MFSTIQNLKDDIGDAFSRTTHYIDDNLSESSKRNLARGIGYGLTLLELGIVLANWRTLLSLDSGEGVFGSLVAIAVLAPAITAEAIILNRNSLPSLSTHHHGLFTQKESYKNVQATPSLSLLESKLAKLDQSVTEIKEDISKLKGYKK